MKSSYFSHVMAYVIYSYMFYDDDDDDDDTNLRL